MSIRLYVGNLPKDVERDELQELLKDAGDDLSIKIVTDRKTGKCRGFAFVTVETDEEADQLIASYDGQAFKDANLKVEKAQPRKKEDAAPAPAARSGGGRGDGARRGGKSTAGRAPSTSTTSSPAASSQPDPRWADELAKLKQQLEAQASNS
ncbi:MAG: RNA-binding protein [Oscillatoriales cyanobacterium]|jgi:RNA recognition motif-containing protein|nr:MAG: RNA-binding protein [Oscillatoriales cyanobacterium]